jgi:hypothetical protein
LTLAAPSRVKGIDPRTREIAEDHARRSGLTLREWLGQVIIQDSARSEPEPLDADPASDSDAVQSSQLRCEAPSACLREIEVGEGSSTRVEAAEHRAMLAIGGMAPSLVAALEKSERAQMAAAARFEGRIEALCNVETHTNARDQAAEVALPRPASAIERLSGEVARIIEVVDLRLARNDVAAAQERAKLRAEVAQMLEQLTERIANAERRGVPAATPDVGDEAHGAALALPELRRIVAEAGWYSPCPSRSLDPGPTEPSLARGSPASTDDDLFLDPEVDLLVAQPTGAADYASFALWADEPFGPESPEANSWYAPEPTALEPDDAADLETIAVGAVFAEIAPGPQESVSAGQTVKVDRGSSPGLRAGSIFGWLGSRRKDATRRGPSKLQSALIVSSGAAVVGMAIAASVILVSTPGAFPERVAGVLGQSSVQPLRLRASETATPFAAQAFSPRPLS